MCPAHSSSHLCKCVHCDDHLQVLSPPGRFSIRIPASFLTFLVTGGPREHALYPTSLGGLTHSPRSPVQVQEKGGSLPQARGTPQDRSSASRWKTCPAVCLRCLLKAKDRSKPKERAPGSLWTRCRQTVLPRIQETHAPQCASRPCPANSHSEGQAQGCQVGWKQTQQVAPSFVFPGF